MIRQPMAWLSFVPSVSIMPEIQRRLSTEESAKTGIITPISDSVPPRSEMKRGKRKKNSKKRDFQLAKCFSPHSSICRTFPPRPPETS